MKACQPEPADRHATAAHLRMALLLALKQMENFDDAGG